MVGKHPLGWRSLSRVLVPRNGAIGYWWLCEWGRKRRKNARDWRFTDKERYRLLRRARRQNDTEEHKEERRTRQRVERSLRTEAQRQKEIENERRRRAKYLAAGLRYDGKCRSRPLRKSPAAAAERELKLKLKAAERAARDAWRWYLKEGATAEWMAKYYAALGKPWRNPRLSESEQYALRYRLDPIYRQKEIHRQGKRKAVIAALDDGTVDFSYLYTERKHCPYCGAKLKFTNRALDHMDPVCRGGAHSASNITVCCVPCNKAKREKLFDVWLACLSPAYQRIALAVYESKRGSSPYQGKLPFGASASA